jgi:hypothetical protein
LPQAEVVVGFYSRVIFPRICNLFLGQEHVAKLRRELLANASGEILEIGFGTGLNLPHYPAHVRRLTAIDPNPGMHRLARKRIEASAIPIAPGSMKASQVRLTPVLAHMALMFLFPLVYAPLLIPYGIEMLLAEMTGISVLPIALPMTLGLLVGVVFLYRGGLNILGVLLTKWEQKILEIVTSKSE